MNQGEKGKSLQHILIVDDQPANLASLEQILEANYQVSKGENGQICLDLALKLSPDLILLDVDMPVMDGLSVCRKLKSDPATSMIPIIFVSALSRLEERLAGYRAGADDYVAKPYNVDELLAKIRIALNTRFDLEAARERAQQNLGNVADSLSTCNELDAMKQFIHDTFDCQDLRSLGDRMLKTFDHFGLRVIVRMLGSGHYFSHAGEVGALDQEMMEAMYDKGRLIDFGHRTLINADHVSVLVRNMPVHDADRYRRWKENLTLLVGVVNNCVAAVENESIELHHAGLQSLVKGLNQLIEHLQDPDLQMDQDHATSHLTHLISVWESNTQAS
ncbi:MAG: response regulator [Candidatus Thiodiazotropha sp. (ex Monitilora ramsayi)]|nr:response regulator [Candidatus Thiodiazotropha sp. (ex Monitilora ramsayi)]